MTDHAMPLVSLRAGAPHPHPIDLGVGFNWFDHLGAGGHYARWQRYPLSTKVYPDLDDAAGWEAILKGLDELNPGWIRFGIPPDRLLDDAGALLTDSIHFRRLERVASWAASRGAAILLDPFVMPRRFEFPAPAGTQDPGSAIINMAARDNRAYAREFVLPLIRHVLDDLGLDAIRYFNPINEPMEYGVYQTPEGAPPAMVHYAEMMREIREALDDAGIGRERIGLIGLDTIQPLSHLLEMHRHGVDIDPFIDAYSVHHYNLRFDHLPPLNLPDTGRHYFIKGMNVVLEQDDRLVLDYARRRGKPLWALEMGTFYYGKFSNPAGVASHPATLTVAEGMIRALNMGVTAFCLWSLMNSNDVDGHWAVIGHQDGQLVRHGWPFAVYGMLSRAMQPGSRVTPLTDAASPEIAHVHGTSIEQPDGSRHVLLVNDDHDAPARVCFDLPAGWGEVRFDEASVIDAESLPAPIIPPSAGSTVELTMPPLSLISLVQRPI